MTEREQVTDLLTQIRDLLASIDANTRPPAGDGTTVTGD